MDNIKIIRLQTGEDLIGNYTEEEGDSAVYLKNPMTLLFKRLPTGKAVLLMSPWLPIELVEHNSVWLYSNDILTVMQPKPHLIEYYNKNIRDWEIELLSSGKDVEDALTEMNSLEELQIDEEDVNLDADDEEELRMELEALRNDVKKRILH